MSIVRCFLNITRIKCGHCRLYGRIVTTHRETKLSLIADADEAVLDDKGKIDPEKLQALIFDQFRHGYYVTGEQVGKAWNAGAALMKGE